MSLDFYFFFFYYYFFNSIKGTFEILSQSGDRGPGLHMKKTLPGMHFLGSSALHEINKKREPGQKEIKCQMISYSFQSEKISPCLQPCSDMAINYLHGDAVGSYGLGRIVTNDYDSK